MTIGLRTVIRRSAPLGLVLMVAAPAVASAATVTLKRQATTSRTLSAPGAAQVTVRALAVWCDGAPRMRVHVDGAIVGTRVVRSPFAVTYRFGAPVRAGAHKVRVTFLNRHRTRGCERGLRVDDVRLVASAAPTTETLAVPVPGIAPIAVADVPAPAPSAPPASASTPRAALAPTATTAPAAKAPAAAMTTTPTTPSGMATPSPAPNANPLAGRTLYVDPKAALPGVPTTIASRPQAVWYGDFTPMLGAAVATHASAANAAGAVPVMVVYDIPQRDCGSYSAGGATSPDTYKAWIRTFAAAIGTRRAIVILEPDALASLDCLAPADRATRFALIADAVDVLSKQANVVTYVDIGHSKWLPSDQAAGRLAKAGVANARGFSLNVSNYNWSADENTYGRDVAARLGSKGFVVDTSRNGRGPAPGNEWCNPAGRGLGAPPSIAPDGGPDANLWIKRPGESDGTCNGGPAAGVFWPEYALGLVQRAVVG